MHSLANDAGRFLKSCIASFLLQVHFQNHAQHYKSYRFRLFREQICIKQAASEEAA